MLIPITEIFKILQNNIKSGTVFLWCTPYLHFHTEIIKTPNVYLFSQKCDCSAKQILHHLFAQEKTRTKPKNPKTKTTR